jgi:hypothetical protein
MVTRYDYVTPPKANPGVLVAERVASGKMEKPAIKKIN